MLGLNAQEPDLLSELGEPEEQPGIAIATFKGTRLINLHTLEVPGKRTLEFRIAHRFGAFNSGGYNFWGLDGGASIHLGLEYSYDGRLSFGIGRTSEEKNYDGFLKYRLIRQAEKGSPPVSVTVMSRVFFDSRKDPNAGVNGFDRYENLSSRFAYAHSVILARKFTDGISLQVAPVMVHMNQVEALTDENDAFILTAAARVKITQRIALTAEYGYRLNDYTEATYYDTFGLGVDIETGGHVFQIHVTNSTGILEHQFLTRTNTEWGDGGIRLGFNISRVFSI